MNILNVSTYDIGGGAAIAAYRLHQGLRACGHDARMLVARKLSDDWTVDAPSGGIAKALTMAKLPAATMALRLLGSAPSGYRSMSLFPSCAHRRINAAPADVVNLHWVNDEFLSIEAIGRIDKPLVWTLHDMWPLGGTAHYTDISTWAGPAPSSAQLAAASALDRWVWRRKRRAWRRPIHVVAPSNWLADCARRSALFADQPITVIPNAIDTTRWSTVDKRWARAMLGLPQDVPLVLFGAMGGTSDARKGFDLLTHALRYCAERKTAFELVVFGQSEPRTRADWGCPVHFVGRLGDDVSLRLVYGACDALVIPSRADNLPNTGLEAQSCGLPIVAFDVGGLRDIVSHQRTGYLAASEDCQGLAEGIAWSLGQGDGASALSQACRQHALDHYAQDVVVAQYLNVYRQVAP
jgi:glycosyltransferase involved in cell wall biosynthesis